MHRKEAVSPSLVCMAEIVGVHGVKGMLKLKVFSENPEKLMDYAPLCNAAGEEKFALLTFQPHQNIYLTTLKGITDRTAAEKLRGTKLYVPRARLPELKDKSIYYHADLIGLAAKTPEGVPLGKVVQVANFGAGDLLEIKPTQGASYFVPFTNAVVPDIDIEKREATVIMPAGLLD